MERQIVLDDKSFKALSADSRVSILKSLGERRRTLSELSQKLTLGNSTVKEHCDILIDAELIKQIDEGRKWKYYELTPKGKQIVHPSLFDEVKVLIVLCIGVIMIGAISFIALGLLGGVGSSAQSSFTQSGPMMANSLNDIRSEITDQNPQVAKTTGVNSAYDLNKNNSATGAETNNDLNNNSNPKSAQNRCPTQTNTTSVAQCEVNTLAGITAEFFLISTIISILFGIVFGWAIARTRM